MEVDMDNYSRMGLDAHRVIVDAHRAELHDQAAAARSARIERAAVDDTHEVGPSFRRRLATFLVRHASNWEPAGRPGH
jgi:hypothetical protein